MKRIVLRNTLFLIIFLTFSVIFLSIYSKSIVLKREEVINNSEEKNIDKPASEPEPVKSNSEEEKLFDTRNISTDPNVNEIIHSNMVDFENFKIKDDKEKMDNENKEEPKNNVKKDNDSDYDDFFDDFFFEE